MRFLLRSDLFVDFFVPPFGSQIVDQPPPHFTGDAGKSLCGSKESSAAPALE